MALSVIRQAVRWTAGTVRANSQDRNLNARRVAELIRLHKNGWQPLQEQDFKNQGSRYNVEPAALHAFSDIESEGNGYTEDGRLKILYEPHVVSRNTFHLYDFMEPQPVCGVVVSYPNWCKPGKLPPKCTKHPYNLSQEERWGLLAFAAELDFEGALKGCSWGTFQILGENWKALGYASVWHMVVSFYEEGEVAQLNSAIRFLDYKDVLDDMRRGEWDNVIAAWNGTGNVDVYLPKFLSRLRARRFIYR